MLQYSQNLSDFLDFVRYVEMEINIANTEQAEAELELSDLEHYIEIERYNGVTMVRLCKRMQEVRHKRRIAKDKKELLQPILEWIQDNRKALRSLEAVLGRTRKTEGNHTTRGYAPRTDILAEFTTKARLFNQNDRSGDDSVIPDDQGIG